MNRILTLSFFTFLSLAIATAAVAETARKPQNGKPAAAQTTETKPDTTKPAETKPEAVKPTEETSVLLNVPLFSPLFEEVPVASVDDEVIPLKELNEAFSSLHENNKENTKTSKIDYKIILDRLINMTLINMEAQDMGLDQLPEVQDDIKKNAEQHPARDA